MIYYVTKMTKKIDQYELDRALSFAESYLKLESNLVLHITFSSKTNDAFGYYEGLSDEEYQIVLNSRLSRDDIIETLFHELVHLSQDARGDFDQDLRLWKNKTYDCYYLDRPWEIEAFYHQDIMMEEYRNK